MRGCRSGEILSAMTDAVTLALEPYRRELTSHCRRVLGSNFEAEDAVQETIVRAWRRIDGFEGRSALRWWLRRIATNVCLDMLHRPERRARPTADVETSPAGSVPAGPADPADLAASREAIRLALAVAFAHLPARQRAMLILRDVLRWPATEVAELLDTSVAAVNSAVQRARVTLAAIDPDDPDTGLRPLDAEEATRLCRYTDSFERYDIAALVSLLRSDAARAR
jgi:RNA polymerase sigma-70 factor, ECF subfamily